MKTVKRSGFKNFRVQMFLHGVVFVLLLVNRKTFNVTYNRTVGGNKCQQRTVPFIWKGTEQLFIFSFSC